MGHFSSTESPAEADPIAEAALESDGGESGPLLREPDSSLRAPGPNQRDRIVVLGRTQAGKTVFISCLYHILWSNPDTISIRAIDGATHRNCLQTVETLRNGTPPAGTNESRYFNLEITYRGITRPLVCMDYPGEVFRKAFVDGAATPDATELLEHIDRAAGVIALIDPAVIEKERPTVAMDDDFGMLKALERIRDWPGGESVPVTLVLTKYDVRRAIVKKAGGPTAFARTRFPQLMQSFNDIHVFLASAVQVFLTSSENEQAPNIYPDFQSHGLVEPLKYLLRKIEQNERETQAAEREARTRMHAERMAAREAKERTRRIALWAGFYVFVGLISGGLGFLTWWMASR